MTIASGQIDVLCSSARFDGRSRKPGTVQHQKQQLILPIIPIFHNGNRLATTGLHYVIPRIRTLLLVRLPLLVRRLRGQ